MRTVTAELKILKVFFAKARFCGNKHRGKADINNVDRNYPHGGNTRDERLR